jgi:hypothetical protein
MPASTCADAREPAAKVAARVFSMLERHLAPGRHWFISHSESLNGITHAMRLVAQQSTRAAHEQFLQRAAVVLMRLHRHCGICVA